MNRQVGAPLLRLAYAMKHSRDASVQSRLASDHENKCCVLARLLDQLMKSRKGADIATNVLQQLFMQERQPGSSQGELLWRHKV